MGILQNKLSCKLLFGPMVSLQKPKMASTSYIKQIKVTGEGYNSC